MSFEGYVQVLCKNGHYRSVDVYVFDQFEEGWRCPECEEKLAWSNIVDNTNGGEEGYVDLELQSPEERKTCPTCNHSVKLKEETYKIPK